MVCFVVKIVNSKTKLFVLVILKKMINKNESTNQPTNQLINQLINHDG